MVMTDSVGRQVFPKVEWAPNERAYLEIHALDSRSDLQQHYRFGGRLSDIEVAENNRTKKRRLREKLKIIAKHEVFDEYLKPLHAQHQHLCDELERVHLQIAALEMLRKKKAKTA
jgi:hypothetical protein